MSNKNYKPGGLLASFRHGSHEPKVTPPAFVRLVAVRLHSQSTENESLQSPRKALFRANDHKHGDNTHHIWGRRLLSAVESRSMGANKLPTKAR